MNAYNNLFKLNTSDLKVYSHLLEAASADQWLVKFHLGSEEFDDSFDDEFEEVIIEASNVSDALKFAEQYARKMQLDSTTSSDWKDYEIVSVDRM